MVSSSTLGGDGKCAFTERWENRYWEDSITPTLLPRLNRHTGGTFTKILDILEYIYKNSEFFTKVDYMLTACVKAYLSPVPT